MKLNRRIAVAMSGGVDSSVAAALLASENEEVFGVMLRLWSVAGDRPNRCCSPEDVAVARAVAVQLGIPFYVIDARKPFKNRVVEFFVDGYARGVTPNPCMECNRHIRWGFLLRNVEAMGATHLATGHYARVSGENGRHHLLRAVDRAKDQSYVLSVLTQEQLGKAVFPLGTFTKDQVRQHARRLGLAVAERPDSQDLCFVGGDYREFLRLHGHMQAAPGPIVDPSGKQIGRHQGLPRYTIGQRKGIGIPAHHPLYVMHKDVATNTLVVGPQEALGRRSFRVAGVNWVSGEAPAAGERVEVRARYKAREFPANVHPLPGGCIEVALLEPSPDVTPGQAAVFYNGERCLGGGTILP